MNSAPANRISERPLADPAVEAIEDGWTPPAPRRPPRSHLQGLGLLRSDGTTCSAGNDRLGPDDRAAHSRRQRVKPARARLWPSTLSPPRATTQSPRRNSSSALVTPLKSTVPSSASRSVPTLALPRPPVSKAQRSRPDLRAFHAKAAPAAQRRFRASEGMRRKQPRPTPAARRAPAFARSGCPPGIQLRGSEMMVGERAARHTNPGASLGVTLA